MITLNEAKQILHGQILRTRDQLIVLLAILPVQALSLDKIKARCVEAGLPKLARKNISDPFEVERLSRAHSRRVGAAK